MVSFIISLLKQTDYCGALSDPFICCCRLNSSFRSCVMSSKAWFWVVCMSSFTDSIVYERCYGYGACGWIPVGRIARNGRIGRRYDVLLVRVMRFLELGDCLLELLHSVCHCRNVRTWSAETGSQSGGGGARSCCRPGTVGGSGGPRSALPLRPALQVTPNR